MAPRGKDLQKDMAVYAEKLQQWAADYGKVRSVLVVVYYVIHRMV
jgi:hypothetical protein